MQQEQLIFDVAMDQVIFRSAKGAHKGWKQAQVTINAAISINALEACLVACWLHLPDRQMVGPYPPFITSLHDETWAENLVAAITDKKGVTHLYLHNPGLEPVEIQRKMVVGMANEPDTFHYNMLWPGSSAPRWQCSGPDRPLAMERDNCQCK
jgi:hypothetical protein